jgi:Fe-S cluster assembly protein SufB
MVSGKNITGQYKYGFHVISKPLYKTDIGLTRKIVEEISIYKQEPTWMTDFRLKSFEIFKRKKMPAWGPDLSGIDFEKIQIYQRPTDRPKRNWEEVPNEIKETFDRLGVPQSERQFLAGTGAQFDSEMIYHNLKKTLSAKGVIFESTDEALKKYPELFRQYFGTIVPPNDNKFAALNSAVWSGGSFIYVPKNVKVALPLQAYFRINARNMGQFERTLIIVDEGADVHYVEGCTAPTYSSDALHAAVVEIIVKKGAKCQYTTVQNWSRNVYNLVTKRAFAEEDARMFWLDCNLGSKLTMKYPAVYLRGRGAKAEVLSVAVAGEGQQQDTGAKIFHLAPDTSSSIRSKSISKGGGRSSYRGLLKVAPGMKRIKAKVACDALILDKESRSDTYPKISVEEDEVTVEHEATVSKIGEEQLFYLMSRGLSEAEAATMIANGFIEPIVKHLPMEYAIEMNRLVEMEMEGSVG